MEQTEQEVDKTIATLIEAVMFEQWLRFTFINEDEDMYVVAIPPEERSILECLYPAFRPLMTCLDGQPVDAQNAVTAIMAFADAAFPPDAKQRALENPLFQACVARFQFWVRQNVEQLEVVPLPFAVWQERFAAHMEQERFAAHMEQERFAAQGQDAPQAASPKVSDPGNTASAHPLTLSSEHAHAQN